MSLVERRAAWAVYRILPASSNLFGILCSHLGCTEEDVISASSFESASAELATEGWDTTKSLCPMHANLVRVFSLNLPFEGWGIQCGEESCCASDRMEFATREAAEVCFRQLGWDIEEGRCWRHNELEYPFLVRHERGGFEIRCQYRTCRSEWRTLLETVPDAVHMMRCCGWDVGRGLCAHHRFNVLNIETRRVSCSYKDCLRSTTYEKREELSSRGWYTNDRVCLCPTHSGFGHG